MMHLNLKKTKLLAVASFGGHWIQLTRLEELFSKYDTTYASCFENKSLTNYFKVPDVNANSNFFLLVWALVRIFYLLVKVRPNLVITTGALPGLICLIMAKKIFRTKTVWIDSIANGDELSKSGLAAKKYADIYLTQWKHLAKDDGPKYMGSVL